MELIQTPRSSNIYAVGHDPSRNVLHVQFRQSKDKRMPGKTYSYRNVSAEQHRALLDAPSVGGHFAKHIKGKPEHPFALV